MFVESAHGGMKLFQLRLKHILHVPLEPATENAISGSAVDANIPTENDSMITRLGHVQPHGCLPADTMQLHSTLTGISLLHRKTYHAFASTSKDTLLIDSRIIYTAAL